MLSKLSVLFFSTRSYCRLSEAKEFVLEEYKILHILLWLSHLFRLVLEGGKGKTEHKTIQHYKLVFLRVESSYFSFSAC